MQSRSDPKSRHELISRCGLQMSSCLLFGPGPCTIFFVMVFLGFPIPVAPPPATKPVQEQTVVVKKKKKRIGLVLQQEDRPDRTS